MTVQRTALIAKIWRILTPAERRGSVLLMGFIIVEVFLEALGVSLVVPAIVMITTEDVASAYPATAPFLEALGSPDQQTLIIWGLTALVGVFLVKSLYLVFLAFYQNRFVFNVRIRISEQLYAIYLSQPWTFHLQRNSAQLVRNILAEVQQLVQNALVPIVKLVAESLLLMSLLAILLIAEPTGAISVAVVLGIASLAFYGVFRSTVTRWGRTRQYHDGLRIQHLQQGLHGVKDVKLLGRETEFLRTFRHHNRAATRMVRNQAVLSAMPRLWLEFLAVLGLAVLVGTMILQGREMATVLPTLALFAAVAFRMMPSVNKLVGALQMMRFGSAAVDNLYEELHRDADPEPRASSPRMRFQHEIEVDDVSFRYPGSSSLALRNVSLNVRLGESIGLIGQSGSGKSTLVDVLLGILQPTSGQIRVDGIDIRQTLKRWQRLIGYVPQSIYLTDDSLRRNIAFGLSEEEIDDHAVRRALTAAQLEDFVDSLEEGVDTVVGEQGVRLSGGQRQRIGIARALYHDPEVLVLDEATSALDNDTEQEFMEAVAALHGKKTIVMVAHRLTTVADCDRIYRLHDGQVTDEGAARLVLADAGVHVMKRPKPSVRDSSP